MRPFAVDRAQATPHHLDVESPVRRVGPCEMNAGNSGTSSPSVQRPHCHITVRWPWRRVIIVGFVCGRTTPLSNPALFKAR